MKTLIKNCQLISDGINMPNAAILIENDRIADITDAANTTSSDVEKIIDATDLYAMPGFIDIHTHGAHGVHTCDATLEAIEQIAKYKMQNGVTTFCPSTVTMPENVLLDTMKSVEAYRQTGNYAKVAGVHLEGPFLNPKKLGGQNPRFIQEPNIGFIRKLHAISPVAIVSFSPEQPGGYEFTRQLQQLGIIPSAAHSNANYREIGEAIQYGLKHLTHFCNQMTGVHHRDIGAVGAGLLHDELSVEIICDKIHLCPEMIKLIFKCKSMDSIMLMTDSSYLSGLPDGEHELRGLHTSIKDGIIRLANSDTLCGSGLKYNIGLKNVAQITELPLEQLVRTTSLNQALALKLDHIGRLAKNYLADIVLLDKDFEVQHLFINGTMKF
jgi:N-acetylglucosamine-6-phosphate deacetylase